MTQPTLQLDRPFFIRIYGPATVQASNDRETVAPITHSLIPHSTPAPLPMSMDIVGQELERWPNLYFEWDGSFVWVSSQRNATGNPRWQIDGMLYDLAGSLQYVELKGFCPIDEWNRFRTVLGIIGSSSDTEEQAASSPGSYPHLIHDVQQNRWLDLATFELALARLDEFHRERN